MQYYGGHYGAQSGYGAPTGLHTPNMQSWREREVAGFLAQFPEARVLNYERTEFEVAVQTPQQQRLPLYVSLPVSFPNDAPQLHLPPNCFVGHPCVHPSGAVVTDRVRHWKPDTGLVHVVREAADALQSALPHLAQTPQPHQHPAATGLPPAIPVAVPSQYSQVPPAGHAHPRSTSSHAGHHPQPGAAPAPSHAGAVSSGTPPTSSAPSPYPSHPPPAQHHTAQPHAAHSPPYPAPIHTFPPHSTHAAEGRQHRAGSEEGASAGQRAHEPAHAAAGAAPAQGEGEFPALGALSNEELLELLAREDRFQALLEATLKEAPCPAHVARLRSANVDLARANKEVMQQCREVGNQITIIRSMDYAPAKAQFDNKLNRQSRVVKQLDPTHMLQALTEATRAADEESEDLVARLRGGSISLDDFLPAYRNARALHHTREQKRSNMETNLGSYLS